MALSSEREGIRRNLETAIDRLTHLRDIYSAAYEERRKKNIADFRDWIIPELVKSDQLNLEELLDSNIPRGSSEEEMRPILFELIYQVSEMKQRVGSCVEGGDIKALDLDELLRRGLEISEDEVDMAEHVVKHLAEKELRNPLARMVADMAMSPPSLLSVPRLLENERRFDALIRDEQELAGQVRLLEMDERRLTGELASIGRPVGVGAAILILTVYSVLGILAPLVVMAWEIEPLVRWQSFLLVGLFMAGLIAVLAYTAWYWRSLNRGKD